VAGRAPRPLARAHRARTPLACLLRAPACPAQVKDEYRVHMIMDNLPAATKMFREMSDGKVVTMYDRGYALGYVGGSERGAAAGAPTNKHAKAGVPYIHNHLRFVVKFHKDEAFTGARIVGFEVEPLSVKHAYTLAAGVADSPTAQLQLTTVPVGPDLPPQPVEGGGEVVFTYDAKWEHSEIRWASRWDLYLYMGDDQVGARGVRAGAGARARSLRRLGVSSSLRAGGRARVWTRRAPRARDASFRRRRRRRPRSKMAETPLNDPTAAPRPSRRFRAQVHWFSIINSLAIVLLLTGIVAMIMMRTLRRDLNRYNEIDKEDLQEESGCVRASGRIRAGGSGCGCGPGRVRARCRQARGMGVWRCARVCASMSCARVCVSGCVCSVACCHPAIHLAILRRCSSDPRPPAIPAPCVCVCVCVRARLRAVGSLSTATCCGRPPRPCCWRRLRARACSSS
jgi:hypothetical protein